jgi:hypothetical protein
MSWVDRRYWHRSFSCLDQFPAALVAEIHLAGYDETADPAGGRLLIDAHGSRARPDVLDLYRHTLRLTGPIATLVEWDTDVLGFEPLWMRPDAIDAVLAAAEIAVSCAYHAPDLPSLPPTALASIDSDELANVRLGRHPATSSLGSPYPIGSIWSAHQDGTVEFFSRTEGEVVVLVTRPDSRARVSCLGWSEAAFVGAPLAGDSLEAAASLVLAQDEAFDFGRAFVGAAAADSFSSTETTGR